MCCLTMMQITMQAINCKHDFEVRVLSVKKLKQILFGAIARLLVYRLAILANLCYGQGQTGVNQSACKQASYFQNIQLLPRSASHLVQPPCLEI